MKPSHEDHYFHFKSRVLRLSQYLTALLLVLGLVAIPLTLTQTASQNYASPLSNPVLVHTLPKNRFHHPLHITHIGVQHTGPSAMHNALSLGYTPSQIKAAYHLPSRGGSGTIAIVDAYDAPDIENDLNAFSSQFTLPPCTKASGCLTVHYQGSSPPSPPPPGTNWDIEISIDVEWAHAIAPDAKILLYEAKSDQPADLLTGVDYARGLSEVRSVSMSWVANEFSTESTFDNLFTANHPVGFFAASGDNGAGVSWPAVSSNVTGVGGTTLILTPDNTVQSETAWNGSGGGDSQFVSEPSYQSSFAIPNANGKRGSPDVSLNADPNNSPYVFVFHSSLGAVGGTSVGTPIWAAMNTLASTNITNPLLYSNAASQYSSYYRDITSGTNGSCGYYCNARTGYDYITGLGSPILLPQNPPQPSVTATSTPTSSPTPSSSTVTIANMQFSPHGLAVPVGTTVTWVNQDTMAHTTTSDNSTAAEVWDSGVIQPGQSFQHTFFVPGQYSYHCSIHHSMTGFIEVFGSASQTPTSSPTPTSAPTGIPPGHSGFQLSICPHGLGNCGDNANPHSGGNTNPKTPNRTAQVSVFDSQNVLVAQNLSVPISYSSSSQNFTGAADMGTLASGIYLVSLKTPGFLSGKVPGIISVTSGQVTSLPLVSLVSGDVNSDDQLDISDYNGIINCYGAKQHSQSCLFPQTSDLNDDGKVDGVDYNIFIRELSVQRGNN